MIWFYIATILPATMLGLASVWGDPFAGLALLSVTIFAYLMDKVGGELPANERSGRVLSVILALIHFPLLLLGVWSLAKPDHLSLLDKVLLFNAFGLYLGQISNSNAHELIHARHKALHKLGTYVYISLLHGHHVSAHLRVHHIFVATDADPNSARKGEGFWRYLIRAWPAEFAAGLKAETNHRARLRTPLTRLSHPYTLYLVGAGAALVASFAVAGPFGILAHLMIASYAQIQLFLSDYVQHYGLRRLSRKGKTEPTGPQHSWNAPHWYSSAMLLNAPHHSDHHQNPGREFTKLQIDDASMPMLPYSLPMMAVIALLPGLWRKLMDPRVAHWQSKASNAY
ncbi:MAG: alkane 1-monooxygenase [Pseudomonadota bacterium]